VSAQLFQLLHVVGRALNSRMQAEALPVRA
jgi:hypothetical protein